jgi:hypothetical protein
MEVVKIRLQAQQHSLADPLETPRYRNAAHAVYTIIREEGFATLYRGVSLTALRQATNQGLFSPWIAFSTYVLTTFLGANFTVYQELKKQAHTLQPHLNELPSYQVMIIGLISGACGPFSNAPIDTIKTRVFSLQFEYDVLLNDCPRPSEIHRRAGHVCMVTYQYYRLRNVARGRLPIFLQRYHSPCASSCTWTGRGVRCI